MSDLPPPPAASAGWYPDPGPNRPNTERYWDGEGWTVQIRDKLNASSPPQVESPTAGAAVTGASAPKSGGLGCFGVLGIIVGVIIVISIIVGAVNANRNNTNYSGGANTGGSSGTSGGSSSGNSGSSTDPIEQARVVLESNYGESHSYATIKSATDSALAATGLAATDDNRSRGWSAVLGALKQPELAGVSPMSVMQCVASDGSGSGMTFPEMAAICAVSLI